MSSHHLLKEIEFGSWIPTGAICEVGSQRENPLGSSYELMKLSEKYSVPFATVDFSINTYEFAAKAVGSCANYGDGADFIKNFPHDISILYLDNYDIAWSEEHFEGLKGRVGSIYSDKGFESDSMTVQNQNAARVHFAQVAAALPKMTLKSIVIIDDTYFKRDELYWFGKGALAVPYLMISGFTVAARHKTGLALTRGFSKVEGKK